MVEVVEGQVVGEETPYDSSYATTREVDGLRRTSDSFMKKQEQHNDTMALNLDQIISYMRKVAARVGGYSSTGQRF
jgi:hypothetical protein